MWSDLWTAALTLVAVVIGVFFMFVASVGVLRMPDFIQRIHAPTKAATLGLIFLLLALAMHAGSAPVVTKALLALLFIGVTAPVGAHILARAGQRTGVVGQPPPSGSPADRARRRSDDERRDDQPRDDERRDDERRDDRRGAAPPPGGAAEPTAAPNTPTSGAPPGAQNLR